MKLTLVSVLLILVSRGNGFLFSTTYKNLCEICTCPLDLLEASQKGVDCRDRNLNELADDMTVPEGVTRIDFSRNHIKSISAAAFRDIPQLTYIDFSDNDLQTLPKEVLQPLTNLKSLILKNNKLQTIDEKAFVGLGNLTTLDLSYNKLKKLPSGVFAELPKLEELILDFNPIEQLKGKLLAHNPLLRALHLSDVGIETVHPQFFPANLTKLETLSLAYNKISVIPSKALFHLRYSLKDLDLSGNPIKAIGAYSFYGLHNLQHLRLDQMLKLKTIDAFAFGDLRHLESCSIRYMPKIISIDPKAFYGSENVTEGPIAVEDFTLSFSILSTLPEGLLDWEKLRYINIQYNHWKCDCNMKWVKTSPLLEMAGNHIVCSTPLRLRGFRMSDIPEEDLVCSYMPEHLTANQSLGFLIGLLIAGVGVSLATVALLVYWRQGWLFKPPQGEYTNIERGASAITVVDDMEWDNKDLQKN